MLPSKKINLGKLADDQQSCEFLEPDPSDIRVYHNSVPETEIRSKLKEDKFDEFKNLYVNYSSPPSGHMLKGTKDSRLSSGSRNTDDRKITHPPIYNSETKDPNDKRLSTNERIRLAGQWFIESFSSKIDEISNTGHPFEVSFSGLSDDEAKDIELLLTLLASAEKTGQGQFDCASKLINLCNNMSSDEGNPVERLVYYFSKAIHEKINREMGRSVGDGIERVEITDIYEVLCSVDKSVLSFHQKLPLSNIYRFSLVHAITENVKDERKVHVIDLEIRTGMYYLDMIQAIVSRCEWQMERLKITAVGTRLVSRIKEAGKRVADFAKSNNIPFSFEIVMIENMLDFNIDLLKLQDDEKVVICAPIFLSKLISKPHSLEHLMHVIRQINPCVLVVSEIEANHTTPAFASRFTEALFFYGALFDSISSCVANDDQNRKVSECVFYGQTIRNIVAADGDERTFRHVGVDVWRSFFARFNMVEIKLGDESVLGSKLFRNFDCESSCLIRVDGGCLLMDWKNVSIFSISAWKFA